MMGFEDRDYSQEEAWSSSPQPENVVTKWFVILTVIIFVMQLFTASGRSSIIYEFLSLNAPDVLHGQVWRLFTFAMCHRTTDIIGIVISLLIIWQFGTQLERMYGSREMLLFYPATALFVGLCFTACGTIVPVGSLRGGSFTIALGLLTLYATHFPRLEVYFLPLITIQLRWLVAIYSLFGVYPAILAMQEGAGLLGLAYASTVLSVVFALAYRRFHWHLSSLTNAIDPAAWKRSWRNRAARRRLRVYDPTPEVDNLETKVDAILIKIHEQGSESLTEAERAVLVKASERAKNRV